MFSARKIFLVPLQLLFVSLTNAQIPSPVVDITARMNNDYSFNKKNFGINKTMPQEFEKQILAALSYFPELSKTKITFLLQKGNSGVIETRPEWLSVFKNSHRRAYLVFIGDSSSKHTPQFMYRNSPVNGQVGIIGHELAHILYFSKRNTFGLLQTGIGHVSTKYMDNFENKTDSITIERGLGYQLIDWNIYLRKAFGMTDPENGPDPFFTDTTRERYMSPARIRQVMSKSNVYK
ncbi:MAG: hypothetical protein JNK79_10585 [Chitinophagaceae bacterium]|nr:hypothetical protein [Chitinophagaceae bacterium]